jgi:hypothetical protein
VVACLIKDVQDIRHQCTSVLKDFKFQIYDSFSK